MKKKNRIVRRAVLFFFLGIVVVTGVIVASLMGDQEKQEIIYMKTEKEMLEKYGVNRKIKGDVYDRKLAVRCKNGTFLGRMKKKVRSYKGIPYAVPPVGKRRWKEPEPAPANDGCYEAYYFGKSPIQTKAETERASFYKQGEDCLTLNVWTSNAVKSSGKPVMVFFPGGGYGWGGTADPIYDGQNFVEKWEDIVLVTVNYRVGMMGFVDFSSVEGGEGYAKSGNLGLLDQVCALEWVKENIAGFGGDPDQVTVFGESAGASSASLLPLMKESKGLFRRIIAQSGSVAFTFSKDECQDFTKKLLKETGCSSMEELLALSEKELMKANQSLNDYNNFPERDGIVLPEDPYEAYRQGKASDIDMMIGTNADETRYWIGEVGGYPLYLFAGSLLYKSTVKKIDEKDFHYVKEFQKLQKDRIIWNRTEFMNELLFRVPAVVQAAYHADAGGNTYMYYWTKESEIPHYGACHAVELAYVFGNLDDTIFTGKPADPALAHAVQKMWVQFAKTGNPSTEQYTWAPYDSQKRNTMFLGEIIGEVSDPMKKARECIEPLLSYRINGYYGVYDSAIKCLGSEILSVLQPLLILQLIVWGVYYGKKRIRKRRRKEDG